MGGSEVQILYRPLVPPGVTPNRHTRRHGTAKARGERGTRNQQGTGTPEAKRRRNRGLADWLLSEYVGQAFVVEPDGHETEARASWLVEPDGWCGGDLIGPADWLAIASSTEPFFELRLPDRRGGVCFVRKTCGERPRRGRRSVRAAHKHCAARARRVGLPGLEPGTSSSRTKRATKLRHSPWRAECSGRLLRASQRVGARP